MVNLDGLGVREDHFIILEVRPAEKVKNHCLRYFQSLMSDYSMDWNKYKK